MIFQFFKIAWRNLIQNRLISSLNILGLSIGIAATLLILQYVGYEQSFDRFYPNAEHVYRLTTYRNWSGKEVHMATTPPPLAETIVDKVPGVEAACRVYKWSDFTMRPADNRDKIFRETNVYAADESFFKVFGNMLLAGDPATALRDPVSAVLTQSAATRYFGDAASDPQQILGRTILGGKDAGTSWKVTGIVKDQPANAHFQFEYLISSSTYPDDLHRNRDWQWYIMHTYALIPAGPTQEIQKGLERINTEYVLPTMGYASAEKFRADGNQASFRLQPLTDIHLHSNLLREMRPNGNNTYIQIFLVVAFFILVVACINYVNLYTAQSAKRAKEVGIKKVIGAGRAHLIWQFLSESFLMSFLSTGLAVIFIQLFQTVLVKSSGGWLSALEHIQITQILWQGAGLMLFVTLLAGIYPALVLTKFRPAEVLKGSLLSGGKHSTLRNGLVVFQFVISICLVAATIVVHNQVDVFKNTNAGFDRENVLVIQNDREIEERTEAFKAELTRHPGILSASFSSGVPGLQVYQARDFNVEGASESENINWYLMDAEHLQTLGIQLAAGSGFRKGFASDSSGVLMNESAVKKLGLRQPVGQFLIKSKGAEDEERLRVLGVMKDFSFESMQTGVKPLVVQFFKGFVFKDYVSVRLAPGNPEPALQHIKNTWKTFEPQVPLQYSYLEADYNTLFESEIRMGKIFSFFTGLALLIACLGLFGLAVFITEQRTKEIGIRKVLGATTAGLVKLLSMDFLKLVLVAFGIATPLAWYGLQRWLENFAHRTDLQWWVFALAGLVALLVALITVGVQSVKAALANPIESLRNE